MHNTSSKAATAFATTTGFDVEELVVDVTYWFDKSTKGKLGLKNLVHYTTYKDIVSHDATRWLSLVKAVNQILELYTSLASYF